MYHVPSFAKAKTQPEACIKKCEDKSVTTNRFEIIDFFGYCFKLGSH